MDLGGATKPAGEAIEVSIFTSFFETCFFNSSGVFSRPFAAFKAVATHELTFGTAAAIHEGIAPPFRMQDWTNGLPTLPRQFEIACSLLKALAGTLPLKTTKASRLRE